jgi:hypothetical protein
MTTALIAVVNEKNFGYILRIISAHTAHTQRTQNSAYGAVTSKVDSNNLRWLAGKTGDWFESDLRYHKIIQRHPLK